MRWLFFCIFVVLNLFTMAQIAEVKVDGNYARIYGDDAMYSGHSVYLGSDKQLAGYNNQFLVIIESGYARVYDSNANYTGHSIRLGSDKTVKNVTFTNILIKEGIKTWYYDMKGDYTGKSTSW